MTGASAPAAANAGGGSHASEPLLQVRDLAVTFGSGGGAVEAVRGVDLDLSRGEILALVGESGSGKSVTAMTLLGLTRGRGTRIGGTARFDGLDLLAAGEAELQRVRGARIAMVFQDALSALNPVHRVGDQVAEQIRAHEPVGKAEARRRAIEALGQVGIPQPARRADAYPHEFSGGMRQRVMIAMALSCNPDVLLADEPTTALDVTVQAQVLDLLLTLRDERGMAILLVTHDLGVVAETADRVAVMYGGRIVEQAGCTELFTDPRHPYTWGLLGSIPPIEGPRPERLPAIAGTPPSPLALPPGCSFAARCPHVMARCAELPPLEPGDELGIAAPVAGGGGALEGRGGAADRCWLPATEQRRLRHRPDGRIGLAKAGEEAGR